ncbi:MAG: hypothetical protein M1438_15320 [Deltaproteobacteria bacterium]|nr:hypothetical protein [Deltaproteobacteria bacterium]
MQGKKGLQAQNVVKV